MSNKNIPNNKRPLNQSTNNRNSQNKSKSNTSTRNTRTNKNNNISSSPKKRPVKKTGHSTTFTKSIYVLFIIFFIYGAGVIIKFFNTSNIDSLTLKSIDITKKDTYSGLIIRDETLYNASINGYLNKNSRELEKVRNGALIFSISQTDTSSLSTQLSQVEDELFNYQTFREELTNNKRELDEIQGDIERTVNNFSYNSYDDINEITTLINDTLEIRKQIIFSDQRINDISKADTRTLLESQIDSNSTKYYAQKGGVVTYSFDNLEQTITPENMRELTAEQTRMDSDYIYNNKIETITDEAVLRVVHSNTWYIGTYIDAKEAEGLTLASNRTLFINLDDNFKEVPARVHYIADTIDKSVYVIFEVNSYMQDFINKRSVDVALKTLTYMNMQVPKSALVYKEYLKIPIEYVRETDTKVVIKKIDDELTTTVPIIIETSESTESFYYLDKTKNDLLVGSILVNPDDPTSTYFIPETKKVPGVYKINNGTASYEKVEINEEIIVDDFVYILPSSSLKEYDRILVHGSSVNEGEIID